MNEKRFPRYLSAPFQVLWFETDEIGIIFLFFFIALIFGSFLWLLVILGPWSYIKLKKKYPRGFLKHVFYFIGLTQLRHYPSFFDKDFLE